MPLLRREFPQVALGLGLASLIDRRALAEKRQGTDAMAKDIVMIHGANEGRWVFRSVQGGVRGTRLDLPQT